jgi:hypothetical protein
MYGVCTSCSGAETLKILLQNELTKQWVVTDTANLMTVTQQSDKFIENLVSKISELTHYHDTTKQQDTHFKESKENLQLDQCIIFAHFSENYSFILQDAAQVFIVQRINQIFILKLFILKFNTCKLCPSV